MVACLRCASGRLASLDMTRPLDSIVLFFKSKWRYPYTERHMATNCRQTETQQQPRYFKPSVGHNSIEAMLFPLAPSSVKWQRWARPSNAMPDVGSNTSVNSDACYSPATISQSKKQNWTNCWPLRSTEWLAYCIMRIQIDRTMPKCDLTTAARSLSGNDQNRKYQYWNYERA